MNKLSIFLFAAIAACTQQAFAVKGEVKIVSPKFRYKEAPHSPARIRTVANTPRPSQFMAVPQDSPRGFDTAATASPSTPRSSLTPVICVQEPSPRSTPAHVTRKRFNQSAVPAQRHKSPHSLPGHNNLFGSGRIQLPICFLQYGQCERINCARMCCSVKQPDIWWQFGRDLR